jgi:predicted nucleic acid-binding protein
VTPSRAVFDASLVLRAVATRSDEAVEWIRRSESGRLQAIVPDLLFAECAHTLLRYVRTSALDRRAAVERLQVVTALRFDVRPLAPLVTAALPIAAERGLSAYDACYVALSDAEQTLLITADRRLAERATNAELVE